MSIQVKQVQKYLASDGTMFNSRAEAVEHDKVAIRKQRLWDLLKDSPSVVGAFGDLDSMVTFLARNGKAIGNALNVVETRKATSKAAE